MRKYIIYLLVVSYYSCNNQHWEEKDKNQSITSQTDSGPYYKADIQIDCMNGTPPFKIHYDLYRNNIEGIMPAEANRLANSMFSEAHACEIISQVFKNYGKVVDMRVEDQTLSFKQVMLPFTLQKADVELWAEKALPFALSYWHKCGLQFEKDKIIFVHYGGSNENIDTVHDFKVVLTGGQYGEHVGEMRWYVNNQLYASVNGTRKLESYGEAGQSFIFRRDTDTSFSVTSIVDKDITIDAITPKIEEIFESIFFELLHKLVWKKRHENMMKALNSPPYYSSSEPVMAEYARLDEVAVHYTVICLIKEMLRKGLFPGKNTTDPFIKYKDSETYRGLLDLLRKYPPTLQNGERVIRSFIEDPRIIDKLYR